MRFEFATATRILFGAGRVNELGLLAQSFGQRAFVVTGSSSQRINPILYQLQHDQIETVVYPISGEPSIPVVERAIHQARASRCDLVISVGGGSTIDTGKAVAAMLTHSGELLDYLEVIGKARKLERSTAPFLAVPTTAGTGSEVTRNAVLSSPEHRIKVSMRSPLMLPRVALVDPELTYTLSSDLTASTGLDALTQLIEPFVCNQPNPLVDAWVRDGIPRAANSLLRACRDGHDSKAREQMALASLYSGLALANAKLGAVHGIAGPFGGMFDAPHGAVCARLLPEVIRVTLRALKTRQPDAPQLGRYTEIARLLTLDAKAQAEDGLSWLDALIHELAIPPLSEYGFSQADMQTLVAKSLQASSMKGHPIALTQQELHTILQQAM